jgi:hypothetical protein
MQLLERVKRLRWDAKSLQNSSEKVMEKEKIFLYTVIIFLDEVSYLLASAVKLSDRVPSLLYSLTRGPVCLVVGIALLAACAAQLPLASVWLVAGRIH